MREIPPPHDVPGVGFDGDVLVSVPVHVADCDPKRVAASRVIDTRLEAPVGPAEQHAHHVVCPARHNDVDVAILIQISRCCCANQMSCRHWSRVAEGAVAVAQQQKQ